MSTRWTESGWNWAIARVVVVSAAALLSVTGCQVGIQEAFAPTDEPEGYQPEPGLAPQDDDDASNEVDDDDVTDDPGDDDDDVTDDPGDDDDVADDDDMTDATGDDDTTGNDDTGDDDTTGDDDDLAPPPSGDGSADLLGTVCESALPLAPGSSASGALSSTDPIYGSGPEWYYDTYEVVAVGVGTLTMNVVSSQFDAYVDVFDATCEFVGSNDDANAVFGTDASYVAFTMPGDVFYVLATSYSDLAVGDYLIEVL